MAIALAYQRYWRSEVRRYFAQEKTEREPQTPFMMVTRSASLKLRTSEKWRSSLTNWRSSVEAGLDVVDSWRGFMGGESSWCEMGLVERGVLSCRASAGMSLVVPGIDGLVREQGLAKAPEFANVTVATDFLDGKHLRAVYMALASSLPHF
jgi:hypothetical protein